MSPWYAALAVQVWLRLSFCYFHTWGQWILNCRWTLLSHPLVPKSLHEDLLLIINAGLIAQASY